PGPPTKTCTPCNANGWHTCTYNDDGEKTVKQEACTSCTPCQASLASQGQFQQTCATGGVSSTTSCTFCKSFNISTPWPLPDIGLRLCIGSLLNPNTWTLTEC